MDWAQGPLRCCCVSTDNRPKYVGDLPAGSSYAPNAVASASEKPLAPQAPGRPLRSAAGQGAVGAGRREGVAEEDFAGSARSTASAESAMAGEEREREKARLQKLVKSFARESVIGIPVNVICPETARITSYYFQMNRLLTAFSLKPTDGTTPHAGSAQALNVKDLAWIGKGLEVAAKAPHLGGAAAACVALGTRRSDQQIIFHFDESLERDRFYTCLRVLRMSAEIGAP